MQTFTGVIPAITVSFQEDYSIDEFGLREVAGWLARHDGVTAILTNGHTGEVFALSPQERAQVTRTVADTVSPDTAVISGISSESIIEAAEHAKQAQEAGASGVLLMPPHYWLRFGMTDEHVLTYYRTVAEAIDIPIVCHVYPAYTKAGYSSELLAKLAKSPQVTSFKVGTRDMSRYDQDIRAIRQANPDASILTCHDEYLLPSLVQGVDGALVGFASLAPELITEMVAVVQKGDLVRAQELHKVLFELKEAVYGGGEPSADAHARMKTAMKLAGRLSSDVMRPPTTSPGEAARSRIRDAIERVGLVHPRTVR